MLPWKGAGYKSPWWRADLGAPYEESLLHSTQMWGRGMGHASGESPLIQFCMSHFERHFFFQPLNRIYDSSLKSYQCFNLLLKMWSLELVVVYTEVCYKPSGTDADTLNTLGQTYKGS